MFRTDSGFCAHQQVNKPLNPCINTYDFTHNNN